jgi:hypothetical protein
MALKPHLQLNDLGSKLETLPSSKDTLIELLKVRTLYFRLISSISRFFISQLGS